MAADLVGLTVEELRTRLGEGSSLATVAETEGVPLDTLVDGLVAAREARVAARLEAGGLTQDQADQRLAGLRERITVLVQREDLPLRGERSRWHGPLQEGTRTGPTA